MEMDCFAPFGELAEALLPAGGEDGAHDVSHLVRVWRNVKRMYHREGGDLEILLAATLLHDCVDVPKDSALRSQASRLAGVKAGEVLAELGWESGRIRAVVAAIESHSYSAGIATGSLEAEILQDADRLDAIGFIGIARCFYTAGRMASVLYDVADPHGASRTLDDAAFALDHFPKKLLGLADGFKTATGRKLAAKRHAVVLNFYAGMLEEVEGRGA